MPASIIPSLILATCVSSETYFGQTKVTLSSNPERSSYGLVVEKSKGPDGDGEEGVLAKITAPASQVRTATDFNSYTFGSWSLLFAKATSQNPSADRSATLKLLDAGSNVVDETSLTCRVIQ